MPPDQQVVQPQQTQPPKKRLSLSIDARVVIFILLAVIAGMLVVWRPWESKSSDDQVITVTGEATVKAEPDEFVFTPSYKFTNIDKDAALAELTKKSEAIVTELKKLGVQDSQIKTNASSGYAYVRESKSGTNSYNLQLTVTVSDKDAAQKVQDYLVTTTPSGAVTPQANFSDAKRKELENKARDEATKEARAKADQSAKNLGFKVGKVKSVNDGAGFGIFPAYGGAEELSMDSGVSRSQLSIQPGENDLRYSVTVIYYVK